MRVEHIETVPQVWLDGEHIGGYTDLAKRLSK
jgi:glutaredoxin